jgi:hypothetical protein
VILEWITHVDPNELQQCSGMHMDVEPVNSSHPAEGSSILAVFEKALSQKVYSPQQKQPLGDK